MLLGVDSGAIHGDWGLGEGRLGRGSVWKEDHELCTDTVTSKVPLTPPSGHSRQAGLSVFHCCITNDPKCMTKTVVLLSYDLVG